MKTKIHYSIHTRLRWSIMALIVSLAALFSICMLLLVFWFENTLFYNHLNSDLDRFINANAMTDRVVSELQGDTTFYKLPSTDHPLLPLEFQGYPEGNFEIVTGTKAYNLFVRHRSPWVYVLLQDQSEFERYELLALAGVAIGFLLIFCFGFVLSRYIATQVFLPVMTLAAAVERKHQPASGGDFAPETYPDDEVGALASAVQRYSDQVAELLQREKQFTADVSHELRTPMMIIQGAADLLKESSNLGPPEQRVVARLERAVEDMRRQITLYLQLARQPDAVEHEATCSLSDATRMAYTQWHHRAQEKGITLACEDDGNDNSARVPVVFISAVLNNLLQNAVNHTQNGTISMEVAANSIAVRDSGSGIDPRIAERIFERGVRSLSGPDSRYGIGLSIVKRICDHQRWGLEVRANQPSGTVFTITLGQPSSLL